MSASFASILVVGWAAALVRLVRSTLVVDARSYGGGRGEVGDSAAPLVWTRLLPPVGSPGGQLERATRLTPYAVETITEDALRAGAGARLEVTVVAPRSAPVVERLREDFARLARDGVSVAVTAGPSPGPPAAATR